MAVVPFRCIWLTIRLGSWSSKSRPTQAIERMAGAIAHRRDVGRLGAYSLRE